MSAARSILLDLVRDLVGAVLFTGVVAVGVWGFVWAMYGLYRVMLLLPWPQGVLP